MTEELKKQLAGIKHVALDMDGTIYLSNTIFPFTISFLKRLTDMGVTYSFLTNNPSYFNWRRDKGTACDRYLCLAD